MRTSRAPRRFAALSVAMTLLVLWLAPSAMAFLCQMDGQARSECCCPQPTTEPAPGDAPSVSPASCCELRQVAVDEPPTAERAPIFELSPPPRITAVAVIQLAPAAGHLIASHAVIRGPPADAHDHLLAKSSRLL